MKKIFLILTTLILTTSLFSCKTLDEVPFGKSAAQILQMGQNAASYGNFKEAELCYNTVLDRFSDDTDFLVQATFELGHIYTKQKKYTQAKAAFHDILKMEEAMPGSVLPKYIKLCNIDLEKIEKALSAKN